MTTPQQLIDEVRTLLLNYPNTSKYTYLANLTDSLEIALKALDKTRLVLIDNLEEPERQAFWIAVNAQSAITELIAKRGK